jgi:hypothetical protein
MRCEDIVWFNLAQDRDHWRLNTVVNPSGSVIGGVSWLARQLVAYQEELLCMELRSCTCLPHGKRREWKTCGLPHNTVHGNHMAFFAFIGLSCSHYKIMGDVMLSITPYK